MKILLLILIAYLLGSIQTGLWIGKVFFHTNLREHGSGNTGTTNTFRVFGKTAGTITFLVDMFKGTLAVLLPIWLGVTEVSPLVIGFFAIIGHVFPIFASFKGGKAVAVRLRREECGCVQIGHIHIWQGVLGVRLRDVVCR